MGGHTKRDRRTGRTDLLVVSGFVVASLIAINLPAGPQRAVGHFIRQTALSPFISVNALLTRTQARARDFDTLRAQMDTTMALVAAQRTLAEENRQLRGVLSLRDRAPSRLVPATVIRSGTSGSGSVFHLDAGSIDGVRPFNAVITETGLLGQVQEVFPDYSLAYDWSHPDFRVSAMTPDGRDHGLVEAARGAFREQDRLILGGTAYLSDLEPGTELLTSGRGGAFPRGIPIGRIAGVAETSAGWSKSYFVDPVVYPGAVTHAVADVGVAGEMLAALADSTTAPSGDGSR